MGVEGKKADTWHTYRTKEQYISELLGTEGLSTMAMSTIRCIPHGPNVFQYVSIDGVRVPSFKHRILCARRRSGLPSSGLLWIGVA
jgi:hypothetical protein